MDPLLSIDYEQGLVMLGNASYETLVTAMRDGLPQAWLSRYEQMCVDHRDTEDTETSLRSQCL